MKDHDSESPIDLDPEADHFFKRRSQSVKHRTCLKKRRPDDNNMCPEDDQEIRKNAHGDECCYRMRKGRKKRQQSPKQNKENGHGASSRQQQKQKQSVLSVHGSIHYREIESMYLEMVRDQSFPMSKNDILLNFHPDKLPASLKALASRSRDVSVYVSRIFNLLESEGILVHRKHFESLLKMEGGGSFTVGHFQNTIRKIYKEITHNNILDSLCAIAWNTLDKSEQYTSVCFQCSCECLIAFFFGSGTQKNNHIL